jgi:asparagine synthase (glutamine-hydrolysing)
MCGIAGFSGALQKPIEILLADILKHRGPDDCGSFSSSEKDMHLFHQRLSILDISQAGHQPMQSPDGKLVLVYNGEIYNFKQLRKELEGKGYSFHSQSDTEVILAAYQAWGEDFLTRMNGIFAFALWDSERDQFLLARDPMGVKPLYYASSDNNFAFCSEIKGLISLMPKIRELDHAALRRYFSFIYCPGDATPFRAVRKLAPGTAMWVSKGKPVKTWSYFRLPALDHADEAMTKEEAVEGTYQRLEEAVRRQMVSDVPIGAFLSGGIDSTAIVALAKKQAPNLKCFTIRTDNGRDAGETDDLPFAKMAAGHLGVSLDIVDVAASKIPYDIERMIWHLDEPIADPASLNTLYISELARGQGIKVLLSGTGGDDIFSGYRRHHALRLNMYLETIPAPIRMALLAAVRHIPAKSGFARRREKLIQIFSDAKNNGLPAYFLWGIKEDLDRLFLAAAEDPDEMVMQKFLAHADKDASPLQKMLALEQRFFLADHNLAYADKMGMAAGVEIRVPMLDLDLVHFAARIPDHYRIKGRTSKWVLKQAIRDHLPASILTRPKTGFGLPIRRWVRNELKEYIHDMLSESRLRQRALFDPHFVRRLIEENNSGRRDAAFTLFSLLCMEIWCQHFLDYQTLKK